MVGRSGRSSLQSPTSRAGRRHLATTNKRDRATDKVGNSEHRRRSMHSELNLTPRLPGLPARYEAAFVLCS